MAAEKCIRTLIINSGSSSIKLAVYEMGRNEQRRLAGSLDRIGMKTGYFRIEGARGETLHDGHLDLPNHQAALNTLFEWLQSHIPDQELHAVGHRMVHGGARYRQPQRITPELVATLESLVPLAPDHLPHELKAIHAVSRSYPALMQVACFDTAFHRQMPDVAQMYALPRHLRHEGVMRYGFHGLSYEYIMQELQTEAGAEAADGRVIIAHLGNGASMAAVRAGKSIDTTMGLTPAGGLVMSTRSGDLDPGVVLYLLEEKSMRPSTVNDLLNQRAGLLAVSGISSDMKELLDKSSKNPHAAEAVDLFCYQAKKFLGAFTAVLGGLDTLIFTGGIGENAPAIRARICESLDYLGIRLDSGRNTKNATIISSDDAPTTVRVMKTDEELMIARHTYSLMKQGEQDG